MPSFPQMSYDDDLAFEPARTVTPFGLTDRQALFLVTVMLHSGLFVGRQDNALAGITHGQKVHDFIEKLVAGKFVNSIALGATGRMLNALAFWTIRVLFPTLLVASMEAYTKAAYDLLTAASPVARDTLERRRASVECIVLPHNYEHLLPSHVE
jgi:hypothetical protein